MTIDQVDSLREKLQQSFDGLVADCKRIQIGTKEQFPFGWRKAAKGRTVWRILEELITQNLEVNYKKYGLSEITPSDSEVSIFDLECKVVDDDTPIYVNVKSAVLGGATNKDDISKGIGLRDFYEEDVNKIFFIGTFFISFHDDMYIEIDHVTVFPITWIEDIYINPSNNGNFQSKKYKNIDDAVKRTNAEFYKLLIGEIEFADRKSTAKDGDIIKDTEGNNIQKINKRWKKVDGDGKVN